MAGIAAILIPILSCLPAIIVAESVLDPSLYLLPSPPLTKSDDPGVQWTQPTRVTRDAGIDPVETKPTTTEDPEPMDSAETFWPSLRTSYGLGGIHIPLTFSVSGTYGNGYNGYGSGVVGSTYASGFGAGVASKFGAGVASNFGAGVASSYGSLSEPAKSFGNYGKSALAGSSYGTYAAGYPGVRVFGNSGKTGWSGWGNGKWGHYGKG